MADVVVCRCKMLMVMSIDEQMKLRCKADLLLLTCLFYQQSLNPFRRMARVAASSRRPWEETIHAVFWPVMGVLGRLRSMSGMMATASTTSKAQRPG